MAKIEAATGVSKWDQIDLRGKRNAFGLAKTPQITTAVERGPRQRSGRSRLPSERNEIPIPLSVRSAVDKPTAERLWRASLGRRLTPQEDKAGTTAKKTHTSKPHVFCH
eukprot:3787510-Pyramimonas_sp.AAC.1